MTRASLKGSKLSLRVKLLPHQVEPSGYWERWVNVTGRGTGKTHLGAAWLVKRALKYPGTSWGAIARTWGEARRILVEGPSGLQKFILDHGLESMLEGGSWDNAYRKSFPMEIRFANGSVIYLASADKPGSLRGLNLHGAWGDEACFWVFEAYDNLEYATRLPLPDGTPNQILLTSTPNGENWAYDLFVMPSPQPEVRFSGGGTTHPEKPPSSYDNPFTSSSFKRGLARKEGTDSAAAELYGLFTAMRGAVYKYDANLHSRAGRCGIWNAEEQEWDQAPLEPDLKWPESPEDCDRVIAGQDLGVVHPTVLLILGLVGERWFLVDEVAQPCETEAKWYGLIEPTLQKWKPEVIWSESANQAFTNAQIERGLNVELVEKGATSVRDGITAVQRQLSGPAPLVIDQARCPLTVSEMRSYRWATDAKGQPLNPERPVKEKDDAMDALRYALHMEEKNSGRVRIWDGDYDERQSVWDED